ncbi:ABC transporter substrate-binding protein, partial [Bacteroides fragilis]
MKRLVLSILLMATFGLAACGNTGNSSTVSTQTSNTTEQTTVSIKDSNGDRVEVQKNPQKVVVFDNGSLDTLDALGVGDRVIGAATKNLPSYLDKYKDVESAGGIKEPDLEKINQLQPDLIIISGRQSDYKEELAKIAPTLYLAVDTKEPWESVQQNVNALAEIFGKEDKAKEELATLTKEIEETKEKASKLEQTALVTLVNEGQLSAYGSGSRFGLVHDVFGFKQADDQIEASTHGQSVS